MPEFNKSRGFKMSGYSYPGEGPLPMDLGKLGTELATMAVQEGVGLGVKAATGGFKKEKGKRKTADASGLSGINFGK
jgi:hypothetical protein